MTIIMTATEASRNFKDVLDRAADGETIVVTRGGQRLVEIRPTPTRPGAAFLEAVAEIEPDPDLARDIAETRALVQLDASEWDK